MNKHQGFTLIELMITIAIMAIILAIAVPSYRQYTVKSSEGQAVAKMQQLAMELNTWRASNLTYQGFLPKKADGQKIVYQYDAGDKTIYVPNVNKQNYTITLVNGNDTSKSLTTSGGTGVAAISWRMFAEPSASLKSIGAVNVLMTSTGLQCKGASLTLTSTDCQGATSW